MDELVNLLNTFFLHILSLEFYYSIEMKLVSIEPLIFILRQIDGSRKK